jgi:hypothetical protein
MGLEYINWPELTKWAGYAVFVLIVILGAWASDK